MVIEITKKKKYKTLPENEYLPVNNIHLPNDKDHISSLKKSLCFVFIPRNRPDETPETEKSSQY